MKKVLAVSVIVTLLMQNISAQNTFPSSGNAGVGTASPSYKLDIYEPAAAHAYTRIKAGHSSYEAALLIDAGSTGGGSYINFQHAADGHWAFIRQNKHLPDMPSAKEVEEKGISVGDNQALLLKKIEELTLYIIAQNKRIEALERKVKSGNND